MTEAASVYGGALYALAVDENKSDIILGQLKVLNESFKAEPDFLRLLSTPDLSKIERKEILDACFRGKLDQYLLNFLKILMEKGYIRQFSSCVQVFSDRYNEDHGIMPVSAVTAVPMSDSQKERLAAKLTRITGKQIELTNILDPACIGGVRLDYDGKRVDDTIIHRLDAVSNMLKNTIL